MLKINNHLIDQIIEIAESKQASDLILLDVSPDCDFADLFIIMSAETKRQIKSILDDIMIELKKIGLDKRRVDGDNTLEWVVIDYGDLIVHIFDEKNREKYSIENVWEKSGKNAEENGGKWQKWRKSETKIEREK